eukprot:GHVR01131927.1.p1 GENE.GHVR01131927.1~~GHVR01131927.1.p1  ORF type:complete len:115 (+),score=13.07 GHVR01131927.1:432-776(+)
MLKKEAGILKPGKMYVIQKALYGQRNAPGLFAKILHRILKTFGYEFAEESLMWRNKGETDSVCVFHVDDIKLTSKTVIKDLEVIGNTLKASNIELFERGRSFKFIGLEYTMHED